ncbi:hypothetical protein [Streptomyces sp. NPDC017529]|uniref:aromatic-ring hydroxylase C-terminal domain-containing protein n=1 Tax=Streptomyces sp. NPDC017529 TaxID=3365000 RepID=UPI0037877030
MEAGLGAARSGAGGAVGHLRIGTGPGSALLLRPDCYVAWQGTTGDGLHEALGTWFRTVPS